MIPKITAGGGVAYDTQNTAGDEVDVTDAYVSSAIAWLSGLFTASLQLGSPARALRPSGPRETTI